MGVWNRWVAPIHSQQTVKPLKEELLGLATINLIYSEQRQDLGLDEQPR
jgi:hypothetical protein